MYLLFLWKTNEAKKKCGEAEKDTVVEERGDGAAYEKFSTSHTTSWASCSIGVG